MMSGEQMNDVEVLKMAAAMAKNHRRMREVWQDVVCGPDEKDPTTYIAALVCLNRCSHNQIKALAEAGEKLAGLVRFAERCVAEAEALERKGE